MARAALLVVGLALAACSLAQEHAEPAAAKPEVIEYYFFNAVSGKVQWEDPGDVPYVDENGNRFWLSEKGEWVTQDANAWRYVWVERWSEEHKRPYYFNQETKQSTWTRPADLAWQRVPVTSANRDLAPKHPNPAAAIAADPSGAAAAGNQGAAKATS